MTPEENRERVSDRDNGGSSDRTQFPVTPDRPDTPIVPRLDSVPAPVKDVTNRSPYDVPEAPQLPRVARPAKPKARGASSEPGSYRKSAIASTAVTAFVTPTIVLSLGGFWLDQRLHHSTDYLAGIGVVLGLIVGTSALLRIVAKLNE